MAKHSSERFGRYELLTKLGHGGMAEVYLAKAELAEGIHKLVALKKIHPAFSENPQFAKMFREEARIATDLNHPNIVQMFHFGRLAGTYYLVMEYVEGLDLARLFRKAGRRMPHGIAAFVAQGVVAGLDYAHRKKDENGRPIEIVHRDISPQNVLVSYDGAVKIADFGIARTRGQDEEEGVVKGKFAYMSPEQAMGQKVDRRSDIYSAGVVLYELVAGKAPFGHLKGKEALAAVRRAEITAPSEDVPDIPPELERIIMSALARSPGQRYQSAREMQSALVQFLYSYRGADGQIYDSEALADFVEQVIPERERAVMSAVVSASPAERPSQISESVLTGSHVTETSVELIEKKKIVVVYGLLTGLVADDARQEPFLRDLKQRAEDLAYKFDVRGFTADSRGLAFVVGVPVSGEEDVFRSVRLAQTMGEAVGQIAGQHGCSARLRVGLARGYAEVRRSARNGYRFALLGGVERTAQILAEHAEDGSIVVGPALYGAAKSDWECLHAGVVEVVSKVGEGTTSISKRVLDVYRLVGRRTEDLGNKVTETFLGRDFEMAELKDAYHDVVSRHTSRVIGLLGEAGVGKRSLVQHLLADLEQAPGRIVRASGRQWSQSLPYFLLSKVARELIHVSSGASREEIERKVDELLTTGWQHRPDEYRLYRSVFLFLVGGVEPAELSLPADPELRQRLIGRTLQMVLSRMAREKPLIVVLGEFHWVDEPSRQLVRRFIDTLPHRPILVLITSRPPGDPPVFGDSQVVDVIHVNELAAEDCRRLVSDRFVDVGQARVLIEQILEKGGGNPYYLLAILDDLVERGACRIDERNGNKQLVWVDKNSVLQIPPTVDGLVSARLDRLDPKIRVTLRVAAVLGRIFHRDDLVALLGRPVAADLDELVRRSLIDRVPDQSEDFRFAKQVIRDVAYQGLSAQAARQLHRAAADRFLAMQGEHHNAGRIAYHLARAGDNVRAAEFYAKAGFEARQMNAHREAFQFFTSALDRLDGQQHPLAFRIRVERAEILAAWGRRDEQRAELETLDDMVAGPKEAAQLANRWMAYFQAVSQPKKVIEVNEMAWSAEGNASLDCELQAEALQYKARALSEMGKNAEALVAIAEARSLCSAEGQVASVWGELFRVEGNIHFYLGEYPRAATSYKQALSVFRGLGLKLNEAVILNNLGFMYLSVGEFELAIKYLKSAYAIYKNLGDRSSIATTLSNLGQVYGAVGDYDKALVYLRRAEEHCRDIRDSSFRADALISIGQLHLNRDEGELAARACKQGLALARDADSIYDIARAQIYLALALLRGAGDVNEAARLANEAAEMSRRARMPQGEVFGLSVGSLALAAAGDLDGALGMSAQAVARLATARNVAESEVILHNHAKLLLRAGRDEEAVPYLEKAFALVQAKSSKIQDPHVRARYLSVLPARDIVADHSCWIQT
ncbi:MAG: protein kinase [Deltaproteobacteria bacterium]|nr:protein kinase [Deltaproteobacteria bacterium]